MNDHRTPVHKASLVDPSLHNPATLQLVKVELSRNLIEHVADTVISTVDYAMGRPSSSSPSSSRGRGRPVSRNSSHARFTTFVSDVIAKAEVKVPALIATLVYIDRAKPHLQIALEQWACERVFLGALIVANKYLNDSSLKNIHWALCSGVFGKRDIGRIEREFLDVLDFQLGITEEDLLAHYSDVMALSHTGHHVRQVSHERVRKPMLPSHRSRSRWSPDSSETDVDADMDVDMDSESDASSSPVSLPRTPDHVPYAAPSSAKHELAHTHVSQPHFVVLPSPSPAHVTTHNERPYPMHQSASLPVYTPQSHSQSLPEHQPHAPSHHSRTSSIASALQLLHSFPLPLPHLPHFTRPQAHAQAQPKTSCRPLQNPPLTMPAHAYAPQVLV